jgi:hypothetical protein
MKNLLLVGLFLLSLAISAQASDSEVYPHPRRDVTHSGDHAFWVNAWGKMDMQWAAGIRNLRPAPATHIVIINVINNKR